MMGIKEYETVRTALLVAWNKIADQVPTTLRNAVDAGIAAVTGAIEKAQNDVFTEWTICPLGDSERGYISTGQS